MTVCSTDCNDDRETFRQSFFRMDNPASFACLWLFCHVRSVLQWLGEKWTCRCHCNHNERCLPNRRACCTGSKIRWVFLKTYSSGNEWLVGREKVVFQPEFSFICLPWIKGNLKTKVDPVKGYEAIKSLLNSRGKCGRWVTSAFVE